MTRPGARIFTTPRDGDLGLQRLENSAGLSISALPKGCIFAIEHKGTGGRTMLNQVLGSPIGGSIGRIYLAHRWTGAQHHAGAGTGRHDPLRRWR